MNVSNSSFRIARHFLPLSPPATPETAEQETQSIRKKKRKKIAKIVRNLFFFHFVRKIVGKVLTSFVDNAIEEQ